jgi:hypothetical protein
MVLCKYMFSFNKMLKIQPTCVSLVIVQKRRYGLPYVAILCHNVT